MSKVRNKPDLFVDATEPPQAADDGRYSIRHEWTRPDLASRFGRWRVVKVVRTKAGYWMAVREPATPVEAAWDELMRTTNSPLNDGK